MLGALAFLAMRSINLNIYAQVGLVTLIGLAAKKKRHRTPGCGNPSRAQGRYRRKSRGGEVTTSGAGTNDRLVGA